jgi:hypothetical protein
MTIEELITVISEYFAPVVAGLISGSLVIFTPWYKHYLIKQKENKSQKVQLIGSLRTYLSQNNPKSDEFLCSQDYVRIRPYLSNELVGELENNYKTILGGKSSSNFDYYQAKFLDEIESIEDSWGISLSKRNKIAKTYSSKQTKGVTIEVTTGDTSNPNKNN